MSKRLAGMGVKGYDKADPFKPTFHPDRLEEPLKRKKPAIIGISFMGDLFHENISDNQIDQVFNAAYHAPQHIYIVLTKRPERMGRYFESCRERGIPVLHWENHGLKIWKGVTVENQEQADKRIPLLLQIPGKRWVSYEPALSEVDFGIDIGRGVGDLAIDNIGLLIAGCESGPGRRAAKLHWFGSVKDQCVSAGVPFFLKQMDGGRSVWEMPELDGKVWDQVPWCSLTHA